MFRQVVGGVLITMCLFGTGVSLAGIWGLIKGEVASKLIATGIVLCAGTVGVAYATDTFFGKLPESPVNVNTVEKRDG